MTDTTATMAPRAPDAYVKRAPTPTDTAAKTFLSTVAITTLHWFMKCIGTGHWAYVQPDDALIELWALSLLPGVHLIFRVGQVKIERWARSQGVEFDENGKTT